MKNRLPEWMTKPSTFFYGQRVFTFGSLEHSDNCSFLVECGSPVTAKFVQVKDSFSVTKYISPEFLYVSIHQVYSNNTITTTKTYAKDFKEFSEDHKYMIDLLVTPKRADLLTLISQGVDLTQYDLIEKKNAYWVLVPKHPESLYLPMLMAHSDLQSGVKCPTLENLEYDPKEDRFNSVTGLGADDRAGCYAINRIMKAHPKQFIIGIFDDEEIGCLGSKAFADSLEFAEVNRMASCYISIDRKRGYNGEGTIATYNYDNKDLFDAIKLATGRDTVGGSSTDCRALASKSHGLPVSPGQTKLACFNMSCGYIYEHTVRETLYFTELQQVVADVALMVKLAPQLWDEAFPAKFTGYQYQHPTTVKPLANKKTTVKTPVNLQDYIDDTIDLDNVIYDAQDLTTLLWLYQQQFGVPYLFATATLLAKDFTKNNYVRMDPSCVTGCFYGGKELTSEMHLRLKKTIWIVQEADEENLLLTLVSEDRKLKAVRIPYGMMKVVTVSDPFITNNP